MPVKKNGDSNYGGRRKGSGYPSFFRGKSSNAENPLYGKIPSPQTLLLTFRASRIRDEKCKELTQKYRAFTGNKKARISRNEVIETLLRKYGPSLKLRDIYEAADSD
jgi:hypothetical protein